MSKTVPGALQTHYDGRVTTLARLLRIVRTDATEHFYTNHDQDIVHNSDTYVSVAGFTDSAQSNATGLNVDESAIQAIVESTGLTDAEIIAGRLDYATFFIYEINYESPSDGVVTLAKGKLGEYGFGAPEFTLELRSLTQHLQQQIVRLANRKCDADLGDSRCGVTLSPTYTVTGTVSSVASRRQFNVSTAPAARGGLLTWTSGNNNGLKMEVKIVSGLTIQLVQPMPFDIAVSDGYSVYRGCDKLHTTCENVFSNIKNFRGFWTMPGNDKLRQYPNAK